MIGDVCAKNECLCGFVSSAFHVDVVNEGGASVRYSCWFGDARLECVCCEGC